MKILFKIILVFGILLSISYLPSAFNAFHTITENPEGWQGGVDETSTLIWFGIIIIGYGFLTLQTVLAVFGFIFGFKKRIAAFWFLTLPGIFGIVLGLLWLFLLMKFDIEWPSSWFVAFILLFPPTAAFASGKYIRGRLLSKRK